MSEWPGRRQFIASLLVFALSGNKLHSGEFIELGWRDLLPEDTEPHQYMPEGLIDHGTGTLLSLQPPSTGVRTDWNGQFVRLPGYVVPLEFSGTGVSVFILVPYVGACIHVPPPPANQLVLVTTPFPYEIQTLFDPVNVTGMFGTTSISTELAEIGYILSAENIEPYTY